MANRPARILVFDSGLGGLTVAKALRDLDTKVEIAYAADNAAFPYGDWEEGALVDRMVMVLEKLVGIAAPDVVVIACNTASTIGLAAMRERFDVPIVGTVPAIKPAANLTKTGLVGVLATPGTVKREYTKALIDTYAYHCDVILHGAVYLAEMAEEKLAGGQVDIERLAHEIAPVFVESEKGRSDVVVLGCTHYPLLLDELVKAAPWPVSFVDPAPAIAKQALKVFERRKKNEKPASVTAWAYANRAMLTENAREKESALSSLKQFGFS